MAMKRKASQAVGSGVPAKLSKNETKDSLEEKTDLQKAETKKAPALEPLRLGSVSGSGRQRKVPTWLAGYVTGSTAKEMAQAAKEVLEKAKEEKKEKKAAKMTKLKQDNKPKASPESSPPSTLPRFPTLVPPSKRNKAPAKSALQSASDNSEDSSDDVPSLRRQSTLKVEDSPPRPKAKKAMSSTSLLTKKSTEILASSDIDSEDNSSEKKTKTKSSTTKQPSLKLSSKSSASKHPSLSSLKKKPSIPKLPSKRGNKANSSIRVYGVDADEFKSSMNMIEVFDNKTENSSDSGITTDIPKAMTLSPPGSSRPKMLEVVICISTSGALRNYLSVLQDRVREMVWKLHSLVPNLRIGVMAHTQGGIHDDKSSGGGSASDHNYIRTGGHSGTKWLDLGATLSQICAFVDSLEPEATIYPDYVQDNLEMALWKLQRSMSWSSLSYRAVIMIGRGRPNRSSFYLQREHWRGWIRSALELGPKVEIPVIDWELEAKLLAQMAIHVFTIQAVASDANEEEEDEGTTFFRRVAEITHGQHIRLTEASNLTEIMLGICCACHGPELLQEHRETVRDENDGFVPMQLRDVFVSLQLHSKRHSLSTLPDYLAKLAKPALDDVEVNGKVCMSEDGASSGDDEEQLTEINAKSTVEEEESSKASKDKKGKKAEAGQAKGRKVNGVQEVKKKDLGKMTEVKKRGRPAKSIKGVPCKAATVRGVASKGGVQKAAKIVKNSMKAAVKKAVVAAKNIAQSKRQKEKAKPQDMKASDSKENSVTQKQNQISNKSKPEQPQKRGRPPLLKNVKPNNNKTVQSNEKVKNNMKVNKMNDKKVKDKNLPNNKNSSTRSAQSVAKGNQGKATAARVYGRLSAGRPKVLNNKTKAISKSPVVSKRTTVQENTKVKPGRNTVTRNALKKLKK